MILREVVLGDHLSKYEGNSIGGRRSVARKQVPMLNWMRVASRRLKPGAGLHHFYAVGPRLGDRLTSLRHNFMNASADGKEHLMHSKNRYSEQKNIAFNRFLWLIGWSPYQG
jgi:hypothetical protein